jgi:hypothetical protein
MLSFGCRADFGASLRALEFGALLATSTITMNLRTISLGPPSSTTNPKFFLRVPPQPCEIAERNRALDRSKPARSNSEFDLASFTLCNYNYLRSANWRV